MSDKLRVFTTCVALVLGLGMLSACNTVEGFGKDLEAAGDSLSDSAEEQKNY